MWIYTGGFFSEAQGGSFRLPNGNTLITDATDARIFEIGTNEDIVWEYEYPSNSSMIARAQRYSYDYFDNTSPSGDLNGDMLVNVLDVIICINIVLGVQDSVEGADLNQDGTINVLDIVTLVNIILGTN